MRAFLFCVKCDRKKSFSLEDRSRNAVGCWGPVEIRIHRKFRGFPACSQPLSNVNWFVNNVWIANVMVMASEGIGPF